MIISLIVGFLSGVCASLGLGGGFILLIYLVGIAGTQQVAAQGINLAFFIPIAILSLVLHTKNKMVKYKYVPMYSIFGILGAVLGTYIALNLNVKILKLLFGFILIMVGLKELFHKKTQE